jgi:hemolysin III
MMPEPGTHTAGHPYSRAERKADAVIHVTGVVAALVCVPVLMVLAATGPGDAVTVLATAIYGASMIAMFSASAGYHLVQDLRWKDALRRLDHATIYLKIAGTYTPFAVLLAEDRAPPILAGIWAAALTGTALKVLAPRRFEWVTLSLYLAMGWAVVVIGGPILERMTPASFALLVAGGLLYTVGVGFHLWESLPFQNAIWHGLVLVATFILYAAVMIEVVASAAR